MPNRHTPPLSNALTTPDALIAAGLAEGDSEHHLRDIAARYAIAVPRHLADLIDPADKDDPIARQVIPTARELITTPVENADPIGDQIHSPMKGLVHRYPDRVLFKVHSACAVYCRFCFRREMVGPGSETMRAEDFKAAFNYIKDHPEIWEVILTGGDPLVVNPERLNGILNRLDAVEHIAVVRIHTRLPVADPGRITKNLINVLSRRRATVYVAVHTNHVRELSPGAMAACDRLTEAGIPLLGQSVLLRGVNDDEETLSDLFRAMVKTRITPYYLHHPDLAPGTSHFRVPLERGQALMKALRGRLSGIALPTYVLDVPGGFGKVPIGPAYATLQGDGTALVEDINGKTHPYPPIGAGNT